jgi:sarcosine oxidase, subunit delta
MKLVPLPLFGLRDASEFVWGGEWKAPLAEGASDRAYAESLFLEDDVAGVAREWWYHVPSATWFLAERDTTTDTFVRSWLPGEEPPA